MRSIWFSTTELPIQPENKIKPLHTLEVKGIPPDASLEEMWAYFSRTPTPLYSAFDMPDESGVIAIVPQTSLNCIHVHYQSEQHVNYAKALHSEADFRSLEHNSYRIRCCIVGQVAPLGSSPSRRRKLVESDEDDEDGVEHRVDYVSKRRHRHCKLKRLGVENEHVDVSARLLC